MVEFNLYDVPKEMRLYDFCNVSKIPYEGSISDPRPRDMEDFIADTTMGEERGVSEARVASLHFPVLCYYALFAERCLIGHWESGHLVHLTFLVCTMLYMLIEPLVWVLWLLDGYTQTVRRVLFMVAFMPPASRDILRFLLDMRRQRRGCYVLNI